MASLATVRAVKALKDTDRGSRFVPLIMKRAKVRIVINGMTLLFQGLPVTVLCRSRLCCLVSPPFAIRH